MKVTIIGTSEITKIQIQKVFNILNKVKGPISFEVLNCDFSSSIKEYSDRELNGIIPDYYELETISSICESFRKDYNLSRENILVVITQNKLISELAIHKNIFSYFYEKNIVVRDNDWIGCDKIDPNIILAHQIVENVFQILSGLRFNNLSFFHSEPQSCINDFCDNEYELQYKIRSAHIRMSCL